MLNNVSLTGRLTRDPEIRFTQTGTPVTNFTLAVNRNFKNEKGESETDFINCVAWKATAEVMANYLKKGSLIGISGRIQTRTYEQDTKRVFITEVVVEEFTFLEGKKEEEPQINRYESNNKQTYQNTYSKNK